MKTKRLEGCSIYIHLGCISAILKASKVDTNGPIPNNISVKVGSPTNLDDSPAHPSIKHWQLMRKRTMHSHPSASYISIIVKQLARRYWCKKMLKKGWLKWVGNGKRADMGGDFLKRRITVITQYGRCTQGKVYIDSRMKNTVQSLRKTSCT